MMNHSSLIKFINQKLEIAHTKYPTVHHSLITNISELNYTIEDVQVISKNMYHVVKNFPRFLAAIISNMENTLDRLPIVENLFEEHGRMNKKHIHLNGYIEFLKEINIDVKNIESYKPTIGIISYIRSILNLCLHFNYLEGLAALGIIEDIVHQVSSIIGSVAKKFTGLKKISHFDEHEVLDERHSQEIYELLKINTDEEKAFVERGIMLGAYYHNKLYTDIELELKHSTISKNENIGYDENKIKKISQNYPLKQGERAVKRLDILNNLYNRDSIKVIENYINTTTKNIIEFGCGLGNLAYDLSKNNNNVNFLATDLSKEQIDLAKKKYGILDNLKFKIADVNAPEYQQKFDIIYCRWLLIYQKNIDKIIGFLSKLIKDKGFIIIEDNNLENPGCFAKENIETIKSWETFWKLSFIQAGQKANIETEIYKSLTKYKLKLQAKYINQQSLLTKEEKKIFYLGVEEAKEKIIEYGLKEEKVNSMLKNLLSISENIYPIDFVKNFQLVLSKI